MVEDTDDLHSFILSPQYQTCLNEIVERTGISIYAKYDGVIFK